MPLGLEYLSTLVGTFTPEDDTETPRPLRLTAHVRIPNALRHLLERRAALDGSLDVDGLAEDAEITGVVERVWGSLEGRCEFCFGGTDGETYRFIGDIQPRTLTLAGHVEDVRGRRMGRAEARFDPRSGLGPLLASVRPIRS